MSSIRTCKAVGVAIVAAVLLVTASCTSTTETGEGEPVATSTDLSALLGPKNEATGTPIRIGFVDDGKSVGIDHTPVRGAFNATVQYANEHLGGINGHKIEVVSCETSNTPTDATNCGLQMVNEKVAAVLVPVSAQDAAVFNALKGAGIPYVTYAAGAQDIIVGPDVFLIVNPIATLAAPAKIANDNNVTKAGIIIIDVPAATGPLEAIARPIYAKAGVDLSVIPISPSTADMTPQIQQAISEGIGLFSVIGTDEFNAQGIKTLKQLGYDGEIVMVTAPSKQIADQVPGGLEGVIYITAATLDPNDKDVQLYNAVMSTYMTDVEPVAQSAWSYALVTALVNALKGQDGAVDAEGIKGALKSMPAPLPLPLGAGLTYHCGANVVALLPNVCTDNALWTELDTDGNGKQYQRLDVAAYMPGA